MAPDLSDYFDKRSQGATPEPFGGLASHRIGPLLFCIQQHSATRLHYDLRLELGGVLKSWALPKGIPVTLGEKHLAVATEDHPFEYANFEGVIPAGQYGAGEMIVWDCGVYSPDEGGVCFSDREAAEARLCQELADGKISFQLRGSKIRGSFALVRMKDGVNWLILKHRDRFAHEDEFDAMGPSESALTGLTLQDLAEGTKPEAVALDEMVVTGPPEGTPKLAPMLATPADAAFDDGGWLFEPKLDGYRTLAYVESSHVRLTSRNGLDVTDKYPEIVRQLRSQSCNSMVLDGEIVAFDTSGKPSFNAMQKRAQLKEASMLEAADLETPCVFFGFDLLHFGGVDTRGAPLRNRRRWLQQCLWPDTRIQVTEAMVGEGTLMFHVAAQTGMEGIIAKRLDSRYEAGRRSRNWLKVKHVQTADFVVGGFSRGDGARSDTFGSLFLGVWDGEQLEYAGNVGSGFDDGQLAEWRYRLEALKQKECPFAETPPMSSGATWIRPETVVEVKFHEWTPEGNLRAPVFLRERGDVDPGQVRRVDTLHLGPSVERYGGGHTQQDIDDVLAQLDQKGHDLKLEVCGETFVATSLDKVLWPEAKEFGQETLTKRDLLRYLAKVSKWMLRNTVDKPLTLIRFPEGIYGERFYQKHWDQKLPPFVETISMFSGTKGINHSYIMCGNLPTLLWLGHLGTLEFHVPHMRMSRSPDGKHLSMNALDSDENIDASILNYPDFLTFDLDPYVYSGAEKEGDEPEFNEAGFEKGKEVAFWLKDLLDGLGLKTFVKLSGKTGLHIFAPIIRNLTFDEVRAICETLSKTLLLAHPNDITIEWSTTKRTGKIFMDYNMNVRGKTLNSAFSPRALPGAMVSMPVTWEELPTADPRQFRMWNIWERMEKVGDVNANLLDHKVDLAKLFGM